MYQNLIIQLHGIFMSVKNMRRKLEDMKKYTNIKGNNLQPKKKN